MQNWKRSQILSYSRLVKLDVESLRALRAVVTAGTFTEAASALDMSQSAVSWKIKRLEERVGMELVKRGGSEIEATPDGRDLLDYADRILRAHDEAVEHLTRSDLEGVIRLGTNEDLRGGELADVLARFGRQYPQIRLDVRVQLSGEVREWFDDGDVDIAVVQIPASEIRPDDVELWREPLQWVHGQDHTFDTGTVLPVVSFGPGLVYLDHAEESLRRGGLRWRTILECPMLSGVQAAVESGLGIAALNSRNLTDAMTVWERDDDHPLPELCEVVRVSGDGDQEVLLALRDALVSSLGDRT